MNAPHQPPSQAVFDQGQHQIRSVEVLPGIEVNGHQEFRVRFVSIEPGGHRDTISEMIMTRHSLARFREAVGLVVRDTLGV